MSNPTERPLRILVIDDDEVDRLIIRRNLSKISPQSEVVLTSSIASGQVAIQDGQYDCVFLDYRLPGGNGLELLQELRQQGHLMPIIVMTSQGDEEVAVEVMKSGGTDYIAKRILASDALEQVLRNALRAFQAMEEQRKTALALAESEARLSEAQRIANIGSWEVDLVNNKRYWSDQMFRILGYMEPLQQLPDKDLFLKHLPPGQEARVEEVYVNCVKEGLPIKFDMEVLTVRGTPRHVEAQGHAIRNAQGRTLKVVGTLQDITHRKITERALIEARDEAQRNAKAKEEFLANMSHEIRTPMNAILGFSKLLHATPLDDTQREYLQAIDSAGQALIGIINDILDFSRIESGKLAIERAPFSVRDLLANLRGMFAAKSTETGLPLAMQVADEVPPVLVGDPVRLNQVLINLVGNAFKFTERGAITVRVAMTGGDAPMLRFEVEDTGIGIPVEKQALVFESFTQASSDTTRKYGGSGLGLTICKRLVEMQGGTIGLRSTPGQGSVFHFELPAEVSDKELASPQQAKAQAAITKEDFQARVLLVEDILLNQRLATRILELGGHQFALANNGKEALDLLDRERFDIVLMDIQMPVMDGYDATRAIRAHADAQVRVLPVVALTAHALPEQLHGFREAGFTDSISKPFQPEQLLALIRRLLRPGVPDTERITDLQDLERLSAGDASMMGELVAIFLADVPKAILRMRAAQAAKDGQELYHATHAVKPSFLLFRVKGAKEVLESLEDLSKGAGCSEATAACIAQLDAMAQQAAKELQAPG